MNNPFIVINGDSDLEINHIETGIEIIIEDEYRCQSLSFQLDFEEVEKLKKWLNQTNKNNEQ